MSFIGLDGIRTTLSADLSATATELPLSDASTLCATIGTGNTSKLEITDGTFTEIVKVTGCASGSPVVERGQEGTTAHAFVKGSCVRYVLTTSTVCELISVGGCAASASCTALKVVAGKTLPAAVGGLAYSHVIAWEGTAPFTVTVLQKPAWMTITPTGSTTGNAAVFSGTPVAPTTDDFVQFVIENCGGKYELNQRLDYCAPFGVTV